MNRVDKDRIPVWFITAIWGFIIEIKPDKFHQTVNKEKSATGTQLESSPHFLSGEVAVSNSEVEGKSL